MRPHGQAVKTLPSHGRIRGSSPLGGTKQIRYSFYCGVFVLYPSLGLEHFLLATTFITEKNKKANGGAQPSKGIL